MHLAKCWGARDLRVVKVSALYIAWRSKIHHKNENPENCEKLMFLAIFDQLLPRYAETDVTN